MISKLNTKIVKKLISKSDNDKKKENKTVNANQIIHSRFFIKIGHNYSANQYVFQNAEETIQVKEKTVEKDFECQVHSSKDRLPNEIQVTNNYQLG